MAEDRISIEIILDDGSIKRGFLNLEKEAEKSGKKIGDSLSAGSVSFGNSSSKILSNLNKAATKYSDAFGAVGGGVTNNLEDIKESLGESSSKTLSNLNSFAAKSVVAFAVVGAAITAAKFAFDTAFEGEKINAINRQFEILATSQGLAAGALKDSLTQISAGLIDDTNLSKIAASAIVTLGESASKLPQLLEVSRKVAFLLGQDFESTFGRIVNAVENGNTRTLKNLNIIIDTDIVYRDFARTLGLTASELNQAQKQQALLNAVIDEGARSFKNIDTELTPLANSFQRLKVTIGQNLDDIAVKFTNAFGGGITKAIDLVNKGLQGLGPQSAGDRVDELTKKIEYQTKKINEYRASLEVRDEAKGFLDSLAAKLATGGNSILGIERGIRFYEKSIEETKNQLQSLTEARNKSLAGEADNALKSASIQSNLTAEQIAAINNRSNQITSAEIASKNVLIGIRESTLQFETDFAKRREDRAEITSDKLAILEQETSLKLLEINKNFSSQMGFTDSQREQLRTNLLAEAEAKRTIIAQQGSEAVTNAAQKSAERISLITSGVTAVIRNGAVALGESLSKAGNSFENFGKAIVGIIADQIVALGQGMIIQGLAIETFVAAINSLLPGSGAAAAAAGLGLVLFGTALKSAIGGGSSASAGSSPSGGGVSGGTEIPGLSPISDIADATPREPDTKIELNIQGDVLDSDQTGMRIVDLLNSAFEKNGVVVTGAV